MKNLIILDSDLQKKNESYYKSLHGGSEVFYTSYEDKMIRKVRNYKIIGSFLYHVLMWKRSYDYAKKLIKNDAQKIICLNPLVGIFLGLLNKNGKEITLAGFLFEEKKSKLYYNLRKKLVNKVLENVKTVVVYSSKEVDYYTNIFPKFNNKFRFIHYGLDYENNSIYQGELPEKYFFSGGGSNRDYLTLVKAMEKVESELPCVIATQPWKVPAHGSSIQVLSDVVVETFGDVMERSEVLILSLKDVELSAGHMVMLQAMSLGVPIIVNDIPSVRDYVDEKSVQFYASGDYEYLANLLSHFSPKSNEILARIEYAQSLYYKKYTSLKLMERLLDL